MEDLWLTATSECHVQSLKTELRVKAVRELPAEDGPGEEMHDRHQVEKSFLQRDVGDVGSPDLVDSRDCVEIDKAGKARCWIYWNGGARYPVDRP